MIFGQGIIFIVYSFFLLVFFFSGWVSHDVLFFSFLPRVLRGLVYVSVLRR